jgi:hypothetical protein
MSEETPGVQDHLNNRAPHKDGFIIDDEVVDVIYVDNRLLNILTSEPLVLDLTDVDADVIPGWTWNEATRELSGYSGPDSLPQPPVVIP